MTYFITIPAHSTIAGYYKSDTYKVDTVQKRNLIMNKGIFIGEKMPIDSLYPFLKNILNLR